MQCVKPGAVAPARSARGHPHQALRSKHHRARCCQQTGTAGMATAWSVRAPHTSCPPATLLVACVDAHPCEARLGTRATALNAPHLASPFSPGFCASQSLIDMVAVVDLAAPRSDLRPKTAWWAGFQAPGSRQVARDAGKALLWRPSSQLLQLRRGAPWNRPSRAGQPTMCVGWGDGPLPPQAKGAGRHCIHVTHRTGCWSCCSLHKEALGLVTRASAPNVGAASCCMPWPCTGGVVCHLGVAWAGTVYRAPGADPPVSLHACMGARGGLTGCVTTCRAGHRGKLGQRQLEDPHARQSQVFAGARSP
jgi:hypothetical protein